MSIFNIYKPAGLTPLEALEKLRLLRPELSGEKMTYAGRLDPLAEGVMLILSGEDIGQKEKFLNLPKTYEVDILFGFSTDTGDILGLVQDSLYKQIDLVYLEKVSAGLVGKYTQRAPRFSAPGIDGKEFDKEIEIFAVKVLGKTDILGRDLLADIKKRVQGVGGDFRQTEIVGEWEKILSEGPTNFSIYKLNISASSGTYMRVLAGRVGEMLGIPALAYRITRTKVGEYSVENSEYL